MNSILLNQAETAQGEGPGGQGPPTCDGGAIEFYPGNMQKVNMYHYDKSWFPKW